MTVRPVYIRASMALLAVWAATGLAACSDGMIDVTGRSASDYAAPEAADSSASSGQPSGGVARDQAYEGAHSDTVVEAAPEAVVVTGRWEVETNTPEEAAEQFKETAQQADGRVASSETSTYSNSVTATVTVRVPSEKYQELVDSLSDYGQVAESTTESEDVGQELVDLDARIAALETSVDRLTEMLESSDSLADVIEVERTLSERQGELDSLRGQKRYLDDQVAMSTLTVVFSENARENAGRPGTWEQAWDAFTSSLSALVIVALGLLPWLVVIGLTAWMLVALIRRRKNRLRKDHQAKAKQSQETDA